jgi:hypothetical protein
MPNTYVLIESKTLVNATSIVEFTSIPNTYTDLVVKVSARSNRGTFSDIVIRFNGTSTTLQGRFGGAGAGLFANSSEWTNYSSDAATANIFSNIDYYIPEYTSSKYKTWSVDNIAENAGSTAPITIGGGVWESSSAITSIQLIDIVALFKSNSSFHLYGIKKG